LLLIKKKTRERERENNNSFIFSRLLEANGIVPDAVFYIEQTAPFLGSKSEAYRQILQKIKRKVNRSNGFASSRLSLRGPARCRLGCVAKRGITPQDLDVQVQEPKPTRVDV